MNLNKIRMNILALILGMVILFAGIQSVALTWQNPRISDEEVILRARELGMVELKEAFVPKKSGQ